MPPQRGEKTRWQSRSIFSGNCDAWPIAVVVQFSTTTPIAGATRRASWARNKRSEQAMKTTTLEPGAFLAARLEKLKRQNRWMKCAVAEVELLVSTEAPLCPSCRQGRLVLTET